MRGALLPAALLAACAGTQPGGPSRSGRREPADGIVTMASVGTIYNPVSPDWRVAQATADRQCRAWGYDGAGSFSGWQEACRIYDFHGRCASTKVTRFYPCTGG